MDQGLREPATSSDVSALRALMDSEVRRLEAELVALGARLNAVNDFGWLRIQDRDAANRDRIDSIYEKLATMNEVRGQLADQARTFATRDLYEQLRSRVEALAPREMVEDIRERLEKLATREMVDGAASQRITRFEQGEARLSSLEGWKNNMQGRMWAIPAIIGLIVFILTQVMRVLFPAAVTQ